MVLISIHPFALRKIFLVIAALLCFSALCLADPVLVAQRYAGPLPSELHDVKRVDIRSRAQEWLPNGNASEESSLTPLVIVDRLFYG